MRFAVAPAALAALLLTAGSSFAECTVQRFNFFPGSEAQAAMSVTTGRTCGIISHAAGQSRFDDVRIIERPKHGTLSPNPGTGVNYRSAPGYRGEDSFVYSITGQMKAGRGTATIRVKVSEL